MKRSYVFLILSILCFVSASIIWLGEDKLKPKSDNSNNKLTGLNYSEEAISKIDELNLIDEINEYSKTLDIALNSEYFVKDNISLYIAFDYPEDECFIESLNLFASKNFTQEEIQAFLNDNSDLNYAFLNMLLGDDKFLKSRLQKYLNHYKNNPDKDLANLMLEVNTKIEEPFYTNVSAISNEDSLLALVNKYHQLSGDYVPYDLEVISSKCAISSGLKLRKEAREHFEEMCMDASLLGYKVLAASPYRSYDTQRKIYTNYSNRDGKDKADTYSARAGHSEHQTGLAVDIQGSTGTYSTFGNTKEFPWVRDNAHKYGFILRYTKETQYITGYKSEPWHYRYVGVEAATYMYENNMTFEEYHALFIEEQ